MKSSIRYIIPLLLCCCLFSALNAQGGDVTFKVIAFYTARNDLAHISFLHEANKWFPQMAAKYHFSYDSTNNWSNLNDFFLSHYQEVIFLYTRPGLLPQRTVFE